MFGYHIYNSYFCVNEKRRSGPSFTLWQKKEKMREQSAYIQQLGVQTPCFHTSDKITGKIFSTNYSNILIFNDSIFTLNR